MLKSFTLARRSAISTNFYSVNFVATVALITAIGVAVLCLVNRVYLSALPYPHQERLFSVFESTAETQRGGVAAQDFLDWRQRTDLFDGLTAIGGGVATVVSTDEARRLSLLRVTADFFSIVGAAPLAGGYFGRDTETPGADRVIVLSASTAAALFGEAEAAVGKVLTLDDGARSVVGVLPASFWFPAGRTDGFVPFVFLSEDRVRGASRSAYLSILGLAKPGLSRRTVELELGRMIQHADHTFPGWAPSNRGAAVITLHHETTETVRPWMQLLLVGVVLTGLVGLCNIASLALSAALRRRQQFAVMRALGATRKTIVRGLSIENGLLALVGIALGLPAGLIVLGALRANIPGSIPRADKVAVGADELFLVAGIWLVACLVGTLTSAIALLRSGFLDFKRVDERSPKAQRLVRMPLVFLQTATATALLGCTALVGVSVAKLALRGTGMDIENVVAATVSRPRGAGDAIEANRFFHRLVQRLRDSGAFTDVAFVAGVKPISRLSTQVPLAVDGVQQPETVLIEFRAVSDGYLELLGISLTEGRMLQPNMPEAIVSQASAARHWPGRSPIGHALTIRGTEFRVVGVAKDVRHKGAQAQYESAVYVPLRYSPLRGGTLIVRPLSGEDAGIKLVRATVRELDPRQTVADVASLEILASRSNALRVFVGALLCLFGLVTLVIAMIGVYGTVGVTATQRACEIAIRLAVGARPGQVAWLIGRHVAIAVGAGLVLGMAGFFLVGGLLSSLLVDVVANDVRIIAASSASVLCAAAAAGAAALTSMTRSAIAELFRRT